jgi:hypothetical protein
MKTFLKSVFAIGSAFFGLNSVAYAVPKVVFTLPKNSKAKALDISSQIVCTEITGTSGSAQRATFYLNDAGVSAVESFTKPLVGKYMEYSVCGGKKQRVKVTEVLSSNMLALGILADAQVSCLNTKRSCE